MKLIFEPYECGYRDSPDNAKRCRCKHPEHKDKPLGECNDDRQFPDKCPLEEGDTK